MKSIKRKLASLVGLATLSLAAPALAGGPLAVCEPGVPYLWPNGGTNIAFNPDQGNLGPVPGPAAVSAVADAFQAWEDIPSSTLAYTAGALLPVDVDITNFGPYLNAPAPDGLSAVVFDDDGQIFDLLFGAGSGILGFAGPEWGTPATCTIDEGYSFLNGPSFTDAEAALDVMVHEFGHWTNFAHTVVNGQLYIGAGDTTGPNPNNTFGPAPNPFTDIVETMYPFYFGPPIGTATPEADDIAIASRMYPEPDYASTTGEISGQILLGNQRVTGVNVIARNVADPFDDAVSAISSDFTDNTAQADPNVGQYRITGLTPGADYAVYVDTVLAGGFSTSLSNPLPGPEEFYNGAMESSDPNTDDPSVYTAVTAAAGSPNTGIDIIFNQPGEGDPLPVGDDGSVRIGLPFAYGICGQEFNDVYVNANGNLTFGTGSSDFSESAQEMLDGPPRIAGLWDDLNPSAGGSVFYTTTNNTFTVTWQDVPEWFATGSNTFSIELKQGASQATVDYGSLDAADGLAGVSCGLAQTGGVEPETTLKVSKKRTTKNFNHNTAIYEWFTDFDNDLSNYSVKYNTTKHELADVYEDNNSIGTAAAVTAPFNTAPNSMFTELSPDAADIDFFSFEASAGQYFIADVTRGQIDSVIGLFDAGGVLIAASDDKGTGSNPLLSRIEGVIPADGTYYLAVTFCCDYDFDGVDAGQGAPLDGGRYVLNLRVLDAGFALPVTDDGSVRLSGFGFDVPFAGDEYSDVFVNMNGNITFGAPS
ncbi:MAG: pre-peptidase C-terminal domain-containing protein, partial [Woeseiaceae bacterium]